MKRQEDREPKSRGRKTENRGQRAEASVLLPQVNKVEKQGNQGGADQASDNPRLKRAEEASLASVLGPGKETFCERHIAPMSGDSIAHDGPRDNGTVNRRIFEF